MTRSNIFGGGGSTTGSGTPTGGSSLTGGSAIRDFVKDNPEVLKFGSSQRNQMFMEVKMQALNKERIMKKADTEGMSDSAKHAMEMMLKKQLEKRKVEIIQVNPTYFNGGRIDKKGTIYDEKGVKIGEINLGTSDIKIGFNKIGKYEDKGAVLGQIKRAVQAHNKTTYGNKAVTNNGVGNSDWFFGSNNSDPTGGFWG